LGTDPEFMNTTLFRSRHSLLASIIVVGLFVIAQMSGSSFGRGPHSDRTFILLSGWTALVMLVVVAAYVLRKYSHRGGYSPERAFKVDHASLEKAENDLHRLQQRISSGALKTPALIGAEARKILKNAGVQRVNRVLVEPGSAGEDAWTVRMVPTEPLGRVARWMHVHVFYGTAFGAVLLMHSGFIPGSAFGRTLAGLGYLVFVTGLIGIFLWARGPRWLTAREHDLSIEEASALHASLGRKRAEAISVFSPKIAGQFNQLGGGLGVSASQQQVIIDGIHDQLPDRRVEIQDLGALIIQEMLVRRELRALQRVRASFMAWRIIHIPAALLLTGMVAVHVVSIWKF